MKKTPSLMVQGTASDVGKSLFTAALCRIFVQDGYKVAPFKSQNMALNSCVVLDKNGNGLEMGRAQALQATAAKILPDVRMNPILLKPTSDQGSQVVLMGKALGTMKAREYFKFKKEAFKEVCAAYDDLSSEYDLVILEGAGSPAEINLKKYDIVNMTMAKHANSKVLLVGDIDRGGVFASFVGTLALLDDEERERVCGLIINKFRGDASFLTDALDFMKKYKPVLGVVNYVPNLNLPSEDSLSYRIFPSKTYIPSEHLDIAIIELPKTSNFTDFDALEMEPDTNLRKVNDIIKLGRPDIIIIPGSKNTIADLTWLKKVGLYSKILELYKEGVTIIGICGGLQMLGKKVCDPLHLEQGGEIEGFSLLDIETELAKDKILRQTIAKSVCKSECAKGYEIHHGMTNTNNPNQIYLTDDNDNILAFKSEDNKVIATYLHGFFDDDNFRRNLLNKIRVQKNMPEIKTISSYDLEPALDKLADVVRASVNIDFLKNLT